MRAVKHSLILAFGLFSQYGFATIVPLMDELVETNLELLQSESYIDGYVLLNKTQQTITLLVQPVMPVCPAARVCLEAMPVPVEYFFPSATVATDACEAVIYSAVLTTDHQTKVIVVDNTKYNYERCPTLAPVPEAVVRLKQYSLDQSGDTAIEDAFAGNAFSVILF